MKTNKKNPQVGKYCFHHFHDAFACLGCAAASLLHPSHLLLLMDQSQPRRRRPPHAPLSANRKVRPERDAPAGGLVSGRDAVRVHVFHEDRLLIFPFFSCFFLLSPSISKVRPTALRPFVPLNFRGMFWARRGAEVDRLWSTAMQSYELPVPLRRH